MRPRRRSRRREYGSREKLAEVCRAHARRLGLVGQAICPTFDRLLRHMLVLVVLSWFRCTCRCAGACERDLRLEYTRDSFSLSVV